MLAFIRMIKINIFILDNYHVFSHKFDKGKYICFVYRKSANILLRISVSIKTPEISFLKCRVYAISTKS